MKKLFAIGVSVIMALGVCACGATGSTDDGSAQKAEDNVVESGSFPESVPEFSAVDLEGATITNDVFSQADLTVVNFWGTFCTPCIDEMPELAKWSKSMPENVQMMGIIVDVASADAKEYALAQKIVEETGVTYKNVVAAEELDVFFNELVGVPTTFFVDKDGKVVGSPIVGADVEGYKKFVEEYLNGQK